MTDLKQVARDGRIRALAVARAKRCFTGMEVVDNSDPLIDRPTTMLNYLANPNEDRPIQASSFAVRPL